jgi:hypothetical protein
MRRTSRSRRPCARGDVLCAEPGRSHPCPDLFAGTAREGISRTPGVHVDEKSDEAIVPTKRPNKGRQLPAEVVEGRASPKGNSSQTAVVRTLSRIATSIRLAAERRTADGSKPFATDVRPEGGARCVSSARRDLCGGRGAILVPTATIPLRRLVQCGRAAERRRAKDRPTVKSVRRDVPLGPRDNPVAKRQHQTTNHSSAEGS